MLRAVSGAELHEQLTRWVAEGLIDAGQAARIEAAEAARAPAPPGGAAPAPPGGEPPAPAPAPRRTPLVVEALGYVGGILSIVAGFIAVNELWPGIPTAAELGFAAVAAVGLLIAGAAVRIREDPAFARLRSALWLMSLAALAAFMGVLGAQVWQISPRTTTLVTASVATAYAAVLWWWNRSTLQHLATFAGAAVTLIIAITMAGPGLGVWALGLALWLLAALWGTAAHLGYFVPRDAGFLAAGVGLLAGAQLTMEVAAGSVLALATVAALLAVGVALREVWGLIFGAIGVLLVVPQTAARYLPASVSAPLAVFVVGIVLLGVAIWLARSRHRPRSS